MTSTVAVRGAVVGAGRELVVAVVAVVVTAVVVTVATAVVARA